jgi:hypothetical protein
LVETSTNLRYFARILPVGLHFGPAYDPVCEYFLMLFPYPHVQLNLPPFTALLLSLRDISTACNIDEDDIMVKEAAAKKAAEDEAARLAAEAAATADAAAHETTGVAADGGESAADAEVLVMKPDDAKEAMGQQDFQAFFNESTLKVERLLAYKDAQWLHKYDQHYDPLDDSKDGEGDGEDNEKGEAVQFANEFSSERYTTNRAVTSIDFSVQKPVTSPLPFAFARHPECLGGVVVVVVAVSCTVACAAHLHIHNSFNHIVFVHCVALFSPALASACHKIEVALANGQWPLPTDSGPCQRTVALANGQWHLPTDSSPAARSCHVASSETN